MKHRPLHTAALLLAAFTVLGSQPALFAQSTFASISGAVRDNSAAIVQGAEVTLTEVQTNLVQRTMSSENGDYRLLNLPAGRYVVRVVKSGFDKFQTQEFELVARQDQRLDVVLSVAAQATQVEVNEAPPTINTENASVSDATTNRELINAPLNYRTFNTSPFQALYVMPEVVAATAGPDGRTATNFDIQGSSWNWTDTSVDGIFVGSARRSGANLDTFPSAENVAELRVNAIGNNAEFAQVADISFITRSGTNQLHGSLFYNYNGNAMNANPFVAYNQLNTGIASRSVNNNFGASAGGRIFRDKTFFFADYEGLRIRQFAAQQAQVIPQAFRTGDFSSLLQGPNPIQLRNPYTGTPYPGNIITTPLNPVTKVLLDKYFPAPNAGADRYQFASPATTDSDQYDVRIDHNVSERQRIFGRWTQKFLTPTSPVQFPALGDSSNQIRPYDLVFSHNFAITPNLLNEFRFGWAQANQRVKPIGVDHKQALQDLGLKLLATSFPAGVGFPHIFVDGFDPINFAREEDLRERNAQYADNVTWTRGRHTWKFGAAALLLKVNEQSTFNGADGLGEFYFQNTIPSLHNPAVDGGTGYSAANFYLGLPSLLDQDSAGPDWEGVAHQYGLFAQDTWKFSRRLTLSYGLRWEYHPPFHENHGNITNFDRATGNAIVPDAASLALAAPTFVESLNGAKLLTAKQAGFPTSLRYPYRKDFGPRVGFAFLPFSNSTKTVIRGGYGIYTIRVLGAVFNSLTGIHTASALTFFPVVNTQTHTPSIVWPNTTDSSGDVGAAPLQGFYTANDPHMRDPYTQQWSLTVEHQFNDRVSVRGSYSGQHALRLVFNPNLNQIPFNTTGAGAAGPPANRPYLSWDYISSRSNGGSNEYNDLTFQLKVKSKELTGTSTYVLAHAITNAEGSIGDYNFTSEIGNKPSDAFNINLDRGSQLEIPTQRWVTSLDYSSPFGRDGRFGHNLPRALQAIAGGWDLFGILTLSSGHHLTPYSSWNTSGIESPATNRADRVSGKDPNSGPGTVAQWFNTAAFSTAAFHTGDTTNFLGRVGNAPVGSVIGPGFFDLDLSLRRNFAIREGWKLALLGQAKNVLNHPNLSDPYLYADDPVNFGRIFGVRPGSTRTLIVGGRIEF